MLHHRFLPCLVAAVVIALSSPAHAQSIDCGATETFSSGLGGWNSWWSGAAPDVDATAGRDNTPAMRLEGAPGTATRDIQLTECASGATHVEYYARTAAGTARVYTKLVDQVSGETLYDALDAGAVTVGPEWTKISVPLVMRNATLLGIAAESETPNAEVTTYIDDVVLTSEGGAPVARQPDNLAIHKRPGWDLTWSDDFSGNKLDLTKWVPITSGLTNETSTEGFSDTWGVECYSGSQVAVSDGALQLTAKQQDVPCLGTTKSWLSGLVISRTRFAQAFGRFEARIWIPVAGGSWPAFWMMPQIQTNYGSCGMYWPCGGEIDILEYVGSLNKATSATEANAVYGTLHWGNAQGGHVQEGGHFNVTPNVARWTVYAVEWDRTGISFFVDDTRVKTIAFPLPDSQGLYSGAQPFDVPFYLILNQAVGGAWAGAPNPADYPNTIKIDYVAAYRRAG